MVYSRDFLVKFLDILVGVRSAPARHQGIRSNMLKGAITAPLSEYHFYKSFRLRDQLLKVVTGSSNPWPIRGGEFAFHKAQRDGTMWDKGTSYGRARWRVLEEMIATVEAMIDYIDETVEVEAGDD